ncbi:MAG TPA: trypsin-like peptidase domain-containing protein [Myxococcaceae bacterium]|nr:trypsin-like peptidase domain-containing protein [Myxococcaceae bacterium]
MSSPLVAVLTALALGEPATSPPPSSSALHRTAEAGGRAWVRVLGSGTGAGVLVGAGGQVLTLGGLVHGTAALVEVGESRRTAHVVERLTALGLVLLAIDGDGPFPAPAARLEPLAPGEWVVGIGEDGKSPQLGKVSHAASGPWFEVSLRLPPGSPVLDGQARLAGVVTARRSSSSRVATLSSVLAQLGRPP